MPKQAGEKLLKGFLAYHGQDPPRTHDLVALLTRCTPFAGQLTDLEADCRNLTYFAVSARYPDDVYEPNEADARAMIDAAHRIQFRVLALLPNG